ncbi:MAG: hypothetical protein HC767_15645 [Akkermansiaceae bacterium]|nr:hypothetical protein [Akkermansiaceae bacterium]
MQPDAVQQQAGSGGHMIKPPADKGKQFEDVRNFLRQPATNSEFMDVMDFVQLKCGGVHTHYRVRRLPVCMASLASVSIHRLIPATEWGFVISHSVTEARHGIVCSICFSGK